MAIEKKTFNDCEVYYIDNPIIKEASDICVTSYYGQRDSGFHYGVDCVRWVKGTTDWYGTGGTIQAFADGKVTYVWDKDPDNKTYQQKSGNTVVIDHGNGYTTKYFHLQLGVSNYVTVGQSVKKGDAIGYMGNTGGSRGLHLHFEVLINNSNVDPLPYLLGEKEFEMANTTEVKTYKVVTTINGYNNAGNAENQVSPSTAVKPGTYYIYTKYPNGVNGMYNITSNTSGATPWCWINPKENVEKVDPNIEKYKNTAVYDLPYENKVLIIDKSVNRTNEDCVKAIKKILEVNPKFDINIAYAFFKIAPKYGIDPMMAISQSILETGWFKFNSPGEIVTEDQHNYGAMGVTDTGVKGDIYATIEDGVIAQMQHLWAYATKESLPKDEIILDKRFSLVSKGCAPYWQQLAGRWAWPGYEKAKFATPYEAMLGNNTYGQLIQIRYSKLLEATVTEADIEKYFPTIKVEEPEAKEPEVETPEVIAPEVIIPEVQEPEVEQKPTVQETPEIVEPEVKEPVKEPIQSENTEETQDVPDIEEKTEHPTEETDSNDIASIILNLLKKLVEYIIKLFKK